MITPEFLIHFLELFLALLLGSLLGTERTLAGKTAGTRTYGLATMGSCLLIIISNLVIVETGALYDFDPLRVAAAIVTGIGFIGAGLIIFREDRVQGLTTAAGLWVAAAIGMAVGYGYYLLGAASTLLTLFAFRALWVIEYYMKQNNK